MTEFVHLHVHSDFSLQDAAVSVMSLADRAEQFGMTHLALTDHGNMFGAMEFIAACKETLVVGDGDKIEHVKRKNPVKPIIGCEVYVAPGSRFDRFDSEDDDRRFHLVLLATNGEGYRNLVRLCSLAYIEGFYRKPRIDEELLAKYHYGLIALSACAAGEIPRLIQTGKTEQAEKKTEYYRDLFGYDEEGNPNFYLEIMDHGIGPGMLRGSDLSQKDINRALALVSEKTNVPLVATNDVHYLSREDNVAHDILLCIGKGKTRSDEKRVRYIGEEFYLKSGDEMAQVFPEYPQAIANTVAIAKRCKADVPNVGVQDLPKYLPEFVIPPGFSGTAEYLTFLTGEGLKKRYPAEHAEGGPRLEEIQKRTDYELKTIIGMNFAGYFLIVADFINWAKEHDIPVGPGRGSGVGSIVAYALRITDINPLRYKLLFERLLNPERISMPDFDIDIANEGRNSVIEYVTQKYGGDRVAQIITFGTLGAKAVIKDVSRVLGISIPESDMITKLIPKDPKITLDKAFKGESRLRELEEDPRYAELFALARKLEGLHRHASVHAAGVVIGKSPLIDMVPLYQEREDAKSRKPGGIATQYSMNFLEPCGLVKMDILGLKTLDVVRHTEQLIKARGGEFSGFSVGDVPEDDKETFNMLCEGKSFAVFQFESDGMQNVLKQAKPGSIEDLIALNAMYRPGPMQNIPQFVESKNGRQKIIYPDSSLESVLKETYGVIVYQEQVMEVARIIAGYSMGQADLLRRAMGKKKKEILNTERKSFLEGAAKQGYSPELAARIYDMLIPFAGYGFNKSHAAAYSVLAYRTAYLKRHFPAEFMAANLTNEINSADKEKLSECIDESRRLGIDIDPPDINKSGKYFEVVGGRIVFGFLGIKGLGEVPSEIIVKGRKNGPYKNFMDFLERVDIKAVGKKTIELLVMAGAFDVFSVSRETLAGNLERAVEYALKKKEDREQGQNGLFDDVGDSGFPDFVFEDFPAKSRAERLDIEKQLIGFYFSGHPLDEYRAIWEKAVKVNLKDTDSIKPGNYILLGLVKNIKIITTGRGDKMAFASLADFNGEIELTFFARAWEKCSGKVEAGKVAILRVKADLQKERRSFIAEDWISLKEIEAVVKEMEDSERRWEHFRITWLYMADLKSGSMPMAQKGSYTTIGFLKSIRVFRDKNDNEMAFGTLQDYEGDIDLVFFSRIYSECREHLKIDEIIALKGSFDPDAPGKPSFKVSSIANIAQLSRSASKKVASGEKPPTEEIAKTEDKKEISVHIVLGESAEENDGLFVLRDLLSENQGTRPVYIHFRDGKDEKVILTEAGFAAREGALEIIKKCIGVIDAWEEK